MEATKLPTLDGSGTDTYVRGTTLIGTLDDSSALDTWKTRQLVRAARSARLTDDLSATDLLDTDEPAIDPWYCATISTLHVSPSPRPIASMWTPSTRRSERLG